jgi:hypothetical protein
LIIDLRRPKRNDHAAAARALAGGLQRDIRLFLKVEIGGVAQGLELWRRVVSDHEWHTTRVLIPGGAGLDLDVIDPHNSTSTHLDTVGQRDSGRGYVDHELYLPPLSVSMEELADL